MTAKDLVKEREQAIHALRFGKTIKEVAVALNRHPNWVRKWWKRYQEKGWAGLQDQSKVPKKHGRKLLAPMRQAICQARSEVEVEAARGEGLKYIGAQAVRTKLKDKNIKPLPSISSIERTMRAYGLTKKRNLKEKPSIKYPHLKPTVAHQLCQVDIVPHFLSGGQRIACFNALDVVSRYPTGQAFAQRRSEDAAVFLIHVWQKIGIARYTQLDNEGCFSGGATHKYVLGKVLRLALNVGTELVFSPLYHPQSNGYVERFHQDYDHHVWEDTYLHHQDDVQAHSKTFFELYRNSEHHSALNGHTPNSCHYQQTPNKLSTDFSLAKEKLPLREGRVHFIRRIDPVGSVKVLNACWAVPEPNFDKGVWVTIEFQSDSATLYIYDAAPDTTDRQCLASYPFPLKEDVLPHPNQNMKASAPIFASPVAQIGTQFLVAFVIQTVRLTGRFVNTMH